MRDYYLDFVSNRCEKTEKRAKSEGAKGAEDLFVPFAPSVDSEYPEKIVCGRADGSPNSDAHRNEIFEERIAIMIFDGGLNEADAVAYVLENSNCH